MALGLDVLRSMRVVADLDFSTDFAISILKAVETFSICLLPSHQFIKIKAAVLKNVPLLETNKKIAQ